MTVVSHGGGISQFATIVVRRLEERILIVIFSNVNSSKLGEISKAINTILHEQR